MNMGKYPNSPIHQEFSDWHYQKCKEDAYLTDIDRLWVETRENLIVAVFDLKYSGMDTPTKGEIITANFFEQHNIPYYIIYCQENFSLWIIYRHKTRNKRILTENDMIEWINQNLPKWE